MSPSPLVCPKCSTRVAAETLNRGVLAPCIGCGSQLQAEVFPALFRKFTPGRDGERVMVEGESSCFYHPQKKAVLPCQGCGRFLCALCDCELHGQHFCPACLEVGRTKGKIKNIENERMRYDSIALSLAVLPLLLFYFSVVTAPIALYVAIRYWNAPLSIVRRSRFRYVLAILFASAEMIGWGLGLYFLLHSANTHG